MITTKIYFSLYYTGPREQHIPHQVQLALTIDIPYQLTVNDEMDLNNDEWLVNIEKTRFNLKTRQFEAFLVADEYENELQRDDAEKQLRALGWGEAD